MWNRRQFLIRGSATVAGMAGFGMFLPGQETQPLPDGSLARGMITPAAQDAIDSGLAFLVRNQHEDGSFGTGAHHGSVAVTALCGLALMAGGHQPGRGRYGRNVTRALRYLVGRESPTVAGFLQTQGGAFHGPMYGHGFATLFLAEAQGMVQQPDLRDQLRGTLDRAVKLIINTQNHEGGWRYMPVRDQADISVTICQIMALRAARNAGLAVPKAVADNCIRYVQECQDATSGGFRYRRQDRQVGFARTAAGVVALYSAGQYEGDAVRKGLEFLQRYQPNGNNRGGFFNDPEYRIHYFYGHYYAAQAMWIAGGNYWRNWFPAIRDDLLNGSYRRADGAWADAHFCPHYCTAMALIILQIPNNYLPILQR